MQIKEQILALFIAALSLTVILERNWFWSQWWPEAYWKAQVSSLEQTEKRDRWKVHELEWGHMQARLELTIAVSAAEEKADCLGMDRESCMRKARQEAIFRLESIEQELEGAKGALADTVSLLEEARGNLSRLQQGGEDGQQVGLVGGSE